MKNDFPLFHNLKEYGFYDQLSEDELIYVLSGIFGKPVSVRDYGDTIYVNNENGKIIYHENSDGRWVKKEYDENNNLIYAEYNDGYWKKFEHDENGNRIYFEDSDGYIEDER